MAVNYSAKEEADGHPSGGGGVPGGGAPGGGGGGAVKTRKPDNTAFKQQRLPAWQPILTAGTVLPAFFIIGLIFIPIGIGIFVTSNNIREYEVRGAAGRRTAAADGRPGRAVRLPARRGGGLGAPGARPGRAVLGVACPRAACASLRNLPPSLPAGARRRGLRRLLG